MNLSARRTRYDPSTLNAKNRMLKTRLKRIRKLGGDLLRNGRMLIPAGVMAVVKATRTTNSVDLAARSSMQGSCQAIFYNLACIPCSRRTAWLPLQVSLSFSAASLSSTLRTAPAPREFLPEASSGLVFGLRLRRNLKISNRFGCAISPHPVQFASGIACYCNHVARQALKITMA